MYMWWNKGRSEHAILLQKLLCTKPEEAETQNINKSNYVKLFKQGTLTRIQF